jgi:hypothetical protein
MGRISNLRTSPPIFAQKHHVVRLGGPSSCDKLRLPCDKKMVLVESILILL